MQIGPVSMNKVVEDVTDNLRDLLSKTNARITHSDLPKVSGDEAQLVQLIQNLAVNGIKYSQAEVPTVSIAAVGHPQEWVFSVSDNGIGIAEPFLKEVFKPFKRLHTTEQYEGTGLGLATCQKIAERHKGRIWCESQVGCGTTFFFTLPRF